MGTERPGRGGKRGSCGVVRWFGDFRGSVCGRLALGLVAGLQPLAVSFMESLTSWRKSKPAEIDEQKLIETLQALSDRLDALKKVKQGLSDRRDALEKVKHG